MVRAGVNAAHHAKYGRYGETYVDRVVIADAAASTLRFKPTRGTAADHGVRA
jgi:hypothetical protein